MAVDAGDVSSQIALNAAQVAAFYLTNSVARELTEHRTGMREHGLGDFFVWRTMYSQRT